MGKPVRKSVYPGTENVGQKAYAQPLPVQEIPGPPLKTRKPHTHRHREYPSPHPHSQHKKAARHQRLAEHTGTVARPEINLEHRER